MYQKRINDRDQIYAIRILSEERVEEDNDDDEEASLG